MSATTANLAVKLNLSRSQETLQVLEEYFSGKSNDAARKEMRRYAKDVLKLPMK